MTPRRHWTIRIDAPPPPGPGGASVPQSIHGPIVTSVGEQWQRAFGGAVRVEPLERIWKRESAGENSTVVWMKQDPDADLLFSSLSSYGVDPDDLVYRLMQSDSVYTGAGIIDAEIGEWAIAQRQATDASERSELLERIRLKESAEAWRLHLVNPYKRSALAANTRSIWSTHISPAVWICFRSSWNAPGSPAD